MRIKILTHFDENIIYLKCTNVNEHLKKLIKSVIFC